MGVPLRFPKFTEGGVPNSEKKGRNKEGKKEKEGKRREVVL